MLTTRAQVEEYLRLYGLPHVEDSSNRDESLFPQPPALAGGAGAGGPAPASPERTRDQALLRDETTSPAWRKRRWRTPSRAGTLRLPAAACGDRPAPWRPRAARLLLARLGDPGECRSGRPPSGAVALCRGEGPLLPGWTCRRGITARRGVREVNWCSPGEIPPPALEAHPSPCPGS